VFPLSRVVDDEVIVINRKVGFKISTTASVNVRAWSGAFVRLLKCFYTQLWQADPKSRCCAQQ
jgi:hypothetical protein